MSDDTEDILIEQPAIAFFGKPGWEMANRFHGFVQAGGNMPGR